MLMGHELYMCHDSLIIKRTGYSHTLKMHCSKTGRSFRVMVISACSRGRPQDPMKPGSSPSYSDG